MFTPYTAPREDTYASLRDQTVADVQAIRNGRLAVIPKTDDETKQAMLPLARSFVSKLFVWCLLL
jgi:hypothetical protein